MQVKIGKKHYEEFCEGEKQLPLFIQYWYLDAVCQDGAWDVILLLEKEIIIAIFPYSLKRKAIFRYITMPHLCFQIGPYIVPAHRDRTEEILPLLLAQLPKVDFIEQRWLYSNFFSNSGRLLSIRQIGWSNISSNYQLSERYSYRFEDLSDLTKVYQNVYSSYRNNKIKKAKRTVQIKENLSIEAFYRVHKLTFDRQGITVPFSLDFLKQLDSACAKRNARKIFYAVDEEERIHSVAYLVWDNECSYLLMGGDDPKLRKSGAGIWLTWHTIEYTKKVLGLNQYDFEGSMIPGVEKVRKSFGAQRKYYWQINQQGSKLFSLITKWRNKLGILLLSFFFLACQASTIEANFSKEKKYLALSHTRICDGKGGDEIDSVYQQIDYTQFDLLLLGGDLLCESSKEIKRLNYLDRILNISSPHTLWALGNHDYNDIEKVDNS